MENNEFHNKQSGNPGFFKKINRRFKRLWQAIAPGPFAWRGASVAIVIIVAVLWIIHCYYSFYLKEYGLSGFIFSLIVGPIVLAVISGVLVLIFRVLSVAPRMYWWIMLACFLLSVLIFLSSLVKGVVLVSLMIIAFSSFLGAGIRVILGKDFKTLTLTKRIIAFSGVVLGCIGLLYQAYFLLVDGQEVDPPVNAAANITVPRINLPDPSRVGNHKVLTLCYGNGNDLYRREYGENADIITKSIDGSTFVDGWKGIIGWARSLFWKFDVKDLPLNGRVWYPGGEGTFPLVLIVHGNHSMEEFSDTGYKYLGELLASNGFITVSVDENFLNGSWSNILGGGLKEESDARGWILLEHLALWRNWNKTEGNPFYRKVDMDKISLIGHSRGGEAVAIAVSFNKLPCYPDDARYTFDYNFNIRSIIAIAPADGQYKPTGIGTPLTDVSYFVLHGGNDGDVITFMGARQYDRAIFTGKDYHLKASLYIFGANHGQFNTVWGRKDMSGLASWLYNLNNIMPPEDQEKIAKVYISAFLRITLLGETGYIPLFRDYRTAPGWLPDTIYLNHFQDSNTTILNTYEEDINLTSTTLPGGKISGDNLTLWKEDIVDLKWGTYEAKAVFLGWDSEKTEEDAVYSVTVPEKGLKIDEKSVLTFSLSDADMDPDPDKDRYEDDKETDEDKNQKEENDSEDEDTPEPIDLTIEVEDTSGEKATLLLSSYSLLQPQYNAPVAKSDYMYITDLSEPTFKSFEFPLEKFVAVNPRFKAGELKTVRFIFNRTKKGVIILDNFGFRSVSD